MFTTHLVEKVLSQLGINISLPPAIIDGVSIDSRKCKTGSMFFAFRGEHTDGHDYISELLQKGVWCAGSDDHFDHEMYIQVPDVLDFMTRLAKERRAQFKGKVIALTGSSGKTSTREMIVSMLRIMAKTVHATTGNLNNHLGLPIVILNTPINADYLVLEMGMNHAREIEHLVKTADPHFSVITNIGTAHIGNFNSQVDLAKAKLEIFEYSKGVAVADIRDRYISEWVEKNKSVRNIKVYDMERSSELSSILPELPEYMLENIYTSSKVVEAAEGISPDPVKSYENFEVPGLRGETRVSGARKFIVDCYNANPESMKKSVESFYKKYSEKGDNKTYLILGSMFELGDFSKKMHGELVNYLKTLNLIERVFLIGCEFEKIRPDFLNEKKVLFLGDVADVAAVIPEEGVFLLKGSRGNRLERLFELL